MHPDIPLRVFDMKALYPLTFLAVLALAGGTVYAASSCTNPTAPKNIPRGDKATFEEMVAAQKAIKEYDAAINAYNACLQAESDAEVAQLEQKEGDAKKKKLTDALNKKQDAALDADKALAARFNEQLRIFKAKSSPGQGNGQG